MAYKEYLIKNFRGIDQSKSENRLDVGDSPDARNMDTEQGNLMVARGYVKHIETPVPGEGEIRRLYIWRDLVTVRYVVIAGNEVYAWRTSDEEPKWMLLYTYDTEEKEGVLAWTGARWDFLETKIGDADYLIIANGERQLIKWDGEAEQAELFGSSDKVSNIPVNYLAMYYNRLISAGDQNHPSRIYWSAVPGDGRTVENWDAVTGSANASGGHNEVGNTDTDPIIGLCSLSNQLLIFKRDSIYRVTGDNPGNFRFSRVNAEVEQMAQSSCILYGDTPFWMTPAGMYYFDGQTARPMPDARSIQVFMKNAKVSMSKGTENRDRLYFTCKDGDRDAIIQYDATDRTYMIRDGFEMMDLRAAAGVLYMINSKRIIYRFDEGGDYDGTPIEAYWRTPLTDLDNKPGIKRPQELYVRGNGGILLADVRVGKVTETHRYLMPLTEDDVLEIPLHNEGRVFGMKFYNEAGSRWTIQGGAMMLFELGSRPY